MKVVVDSLTGKKKALTYMEHAVILATSCQSPTGSRTSLRNVASTHRSAVALRAAECISRLRQ